MRFRLTQSHIDRGFRRNGEACPYAICIREALGGKTPVTVGATHASVNGQTGIELPPEVKSDIAAFDADLRIGPGREFELAIR